MTETELQKDVVVVEDQKPDVEKWVALPGGCVVHGTHLISDKLVGIIGEIMKKDTYKDNFGVRCIEFKDNGYPAGKAGMAYIDGGTVAINLEEIWSATLTCLEEGKVKLSMTGIIWSELITTILHEIHHIDACRDVDYRAMAEDDPSGADADAEDWAKEIMVDLAMKFDVEPAILAYMSFFKVKLMELMTSEMKDEEWVAEARRQIENGIMYYDVDNDITTKTFREYLRAITDPGEKDDNWEQGVSVIDLIFSMDDGSVVETKEELPIPVVEATVADAPTEEVTVDGTTSSVGALFGTIDEDIPAGGEEVDPGFAESVPLPDHIVAEQAQVAAAAVAVPPVAPTAVTYELNGLSNETMVAFLKDVYMRLYSHIFTKCGWQLNSDQGFTNPGAVLEPVSIADLIQLHAAKGLIMEYDTLNAEGHRQPEMCEGHIRGLVFNKSNQHGIPAFAIYLNINGMRVKRSLIAQNPAKVNNAGQYSSMALEARAGHAITWLMSEDENKKFVAKIRDNIYEAL